MSKTTVFVIIIVAVIAGIALYSGSQPMERESIVPVVPMQKAQKPTLNSEVSAIDAQLTSLDADTANITQGINDNPIDPTL